MLSVCTVLQLLLHKNQKHHNILLKTRSTKITNAIHNTTRIDIKLIIVSVV